MEWEGLDVDDSDLPSLLRPALLPCTNTNNNKRPHSHSHSHSQSNTQTQPLLSQPPKNNSSPDVPAGPSNRPRPLIPGPAGAVQATMLRKTAQAGSQSRLSDCRPTQVSQDDEDDDFAQNPWLCTLDFLGLEAGFPLPHSIKAIRSMERAPQVVGIIKSCTPNGLGDLIVTLKDPTGTIGASIHHNVLAENMAGRDISVGSVVILQQVVAFDLTHLSCYLNITPKNVVKIFSKNSGPPIKRSFPAVTIRSSALEEHVEIHSWVHEKSTSVNKGAAVAANEAERREAGKDEGKSSERTSGHAAGSFDRSSTLHGKAYVVEEPYHESSARSGVNPLISRVPIADWTDEQLNELFAGDDNDNLLG